MGCTWEITEWMFAAAIVMIVVSMWLAVKTAGDFGKIKGIIEGRKRVATDLVVRCEKMIDTYRAQPDGYDRFAKEIELLQSLSDELIDKYELEDEL